MTDPDDLLAATEALDPDQLAAALFPEALHSWLALEQAHRCLAVVRDELEKRLADQLTEPATIIGVGVVERQGRRDRKTWNSDALLSAVLDSRLIDPRTGEIADESPLDKVRHCWNLGAPRLTALRDRGIDPDQFCSSEWRGYSIRVTHS